MGFAWQWGEVTVQNKEVIIKSLKKVSEISFKKPKGEKRIPS